MATWHGNQGSSSLPNMGDGQSNPSLPPLTPPQLPQQPVVSPPSAVVAPQPVATQPVVPQPTVQLPPLTPVLPTVPMNPPVVATPPQPIDPQPLPVIPPQTVQPQPLQVSPPVIPAAVPSPQAMSSMVSGQFTSESATSSPITAYMPAIIGISIVLVVGGVGAFFGVQHYNETKKSYLDNTAKQIENFSLVQDEYDNIISLISGSKSTSTKRSSTQVLGIIDEEVVEQMDEDFFDKPSQKLKETYNKVLGIEDSPEVQAMRTYDEHLNIVLSKLDDIEVENQEIKKLDRNLLTQFLIPPAKKVSQSTDDFIVKTQALMRYQDEMNQIGIEAISAGFEWGQAMQEALMSNADPTYVKNLEKKTEKIIDLKNRVKRVSTDGLSTEIQDKHKESLEEMETQFQIFEDITDAIKKKDVVTLQSLVNSMMSQSSTQTETTSTVSFWENDPLINSVQKVKKEWMDYQAKLK